MPKSQYQFSAKMWRYSSDTASWYFVHLEDKLAKEIKTLVKERKIRTKGFSFVPVEATVGNSTWRTTLFPGKDDSYLLSINKKVRNQEELDEGDTIKVAFKLT